MILTKPLKLKNRRYPGLRKEDNGKDRGFRSISMTESVQYMFIERDDDEEEPFEGEDEEYEDMDKETEMEMEVESEFAGEI